MNQSYSVPTETISPGIYQRCLWAFAVAGVVIVFFFTAWLSMQRVKIATAQRCTREAERRAAILQLAHDAAMRERRETINALNVRLAKSEAARVDRLEGAREMAKGDVKSVAASPRGKPSVSNRDVPQAGLEGPNAQELKAFIQAHLSRMAGTVDVSDYADQVDFHDKPRATIELIENERKQWAQRYPVRVIFADEIQPQFSAVRDAAYPWVATAVFNWRFEFRTKIGAVIRGVARDIWKIAPTNSGLRIVAEHSADPTTGASKD